MLVLSSAATDETNSSRNLKDSFFFGKIGSTTRKADVTSKSR